MKYREDMMESCKKSPGMCSDHSGITPKNLDLIVSLTCLREKRERELLVDVCGLVREGEKGTPHISQTARPHLSTLVRNVRDTQVDRLPLKFLPQYSSGTASDHPFSAMADYPRTHGRPSASRSESIPLVYPMLTGCTEDTRTVRHCNFVAENLSAEPLVTNPMNGGPSASYPRTVRATKVQSVQNFVNFLNFNSNLGSLLI